MDIWSTLQTAGVSFLFSLLLLVLKWVMTPGVRLIWGVPHDFYHRPKIADEEVGIATGTVYVGNIGRNTATNLEVVFDWNVETLSVWPQRAYEVSANPEGRMCLKVSNLGPKEFLVIHLMDIGRRLPQVLTVRSAEASGRLVNIVPQRLFPQWLNYSVVSLMFLGVVGIIYIAMRIFQFLIK